MIRLSVLRDSTVSGEYPVNQYGVVVLPLLGDVVVSGQTERSFRDRVIHALQEVRVGPAIEVVVLRRVLVSGEVNAPGVYSMEPTATVADAVATARGVTPLAREGTVMLRHRGEVRYRTGDLRRDTALARAPIQSGDEVRVPRRGWVDRNIGTVVGATSAAAGILVTLLLR